MKFTPVGLTIWLLFTINLIKAQQIEEKAIAPYFYIPGLDEDIDYLPIKDITADVHISGTIADVELEQTFMNDGFEPVEAIFVFPGSTNSAIYSLEVTIGDRVIKAEIEERTKARNTYRKAKNDGYRATLLEQKRPNVFEMSVANLMPGDIVKTKLKYTELIEPKDDKYRFVLPTTVGPRYSKELITKRETKWVTNPYLESGQLPPFTFNIQLQISTGVSIQDIRSTSHKVDVQFTRSGECLLKLDNPNQGDRDFILEYFLKGNQINSGILLHEDSTENFFTLIVQPPENVNEDEVPNREFIFVIDVSGSMNGFPIKTAKELMNNLLSSLKPTDLFNISLFEFGSKKVFYKSLPCTPENISRALSKLMRQQGSGGTNLYSALEEAITLEPAENFSRSMVVITDGFITAERDVHELIRDNLNETNVYAFGIGSSVNRHLIEGIAKAGMGEPFVVEGKSYAKTRAQEFLEYINRPALTNIKIDYGNNLVREVWPKSIPDVTANRPIIVHGKYSGEFHGGVKLTGDYGKGKFERSVLLDPESSKNNPALKYLWARTTIKELVEYEKPRKSVASRVKDIGLKYSLLTDYTSFVAVDTELVIKKEKATKVRQPLVMPKGVSSNFTGYRYSSYSGGYSPSGSNGYRVTGATSRGSAGNIDLLLPRLGENKFDVFNDQFLLRWSPLDGVTTYVVTIKDIFNNTLGEFKTNSDAVWIDLSSPELYNEGSLLIIGVSVDSKPDESSSDYAIKYVPGEYQGIPQLPEEDDKRPLEFYTELEETYEKHGLLLDAFSCLEMALTHYSGDPDLQQVVNNFLIRNRMF